MASLIGSVLAGGVSGGAKANMETLRNNAEEIRKQSYAELIQKYAKENIELQDRLGVSRDATKHDNAIKERTLTNEGLIAAAKEKSGGDTLYDINGTPVTEENYKPGMKLYKEALGRKEAKTSSSQAELDTLVGTFGKEKGQEMFSRQYDKKDSDTPKPEYKQGQAIKEQTQVLKAIGMINRGETLTEESIGKMSPAMAAMLPFLDTKTGMPEEDKEKYIAKLQEFYDYLSQFSNGKGIISNATSSKDVIEPAPLNLEDIPQEETPQTAKKRKPLSSFSRK